VAVAELNGHMLQAILRILRRMDFIRVVLSTCGTKGLAATVECLRPDLLLLDFRMAAKLERSAGYKLILLTIHDDGELRAVTEDAAADAVLCKVRLDEELQLAIARLFPGPLPA